MIGRLNHVASAVPDLEAAAAVYRGLLGAELSEAVPQPAHGVTVIFVPLPNAKIELLHPLGADSPIAAFLEHNPAGGLHHLCYEVAAILAARARLKPGHPRVLRAVGPSHGPQRKPVIFLPSPDSRRRTERGRAR